MKRNNWLVASGVGLAALGAVATAAPASAEGINLGASLSCSYTLDAHTYHVAGQCSGTSPLGGASGAFSGTVSPSNGSGSGSFTLTTPLGSGSGSFEGTFSLGGGTASGTFTVKVLGINVPGVWIGISS